MQIELIQNKIHTIRGKQIMLDFDLAKLYEVQTRNLNKAIKRNINRFPIDFMFQLSLNEFKDLMFQFGTSSWGGTRKLPFAFTEQGVATLSGVLRSEKAIKVHIEIMRAFVSMRKFITTNGQIFYRLENVENKQIEFQTQIDKQFEKVFSAIEDKDIKPSKGVFFNGTVFDSHKFVSDLIRSARKSIILIDNYIDDRVLILFSKRKKNVMVKIYTKVISKQLNLDLKKYNLQYDPIEIIKFEDSHDRFLIIDDDVYHFGASLKDLGRKWFAFSKFEKDAFKIMDKLS